MTAAAALQKEYQQRADARREARYCRPHKVYEMWAGDRCIYVGMTVDLEHRLTDHRKTSFWWSETTAIHSTEYADWHSAEWAERHCILMLRPAYNLRWNPNQDPTLLARPSIVAFLARADARLAKAAA